MLHILNLSHAEAGIINVRQGLPLPRGRYSVNRPLEVCNERQEALAFNCRALSLWPDKSIRFLLLEGEYEFQRAGTTEALYLQEQAESKLSIKKKFLHDTPEALKVDLAHTSFVFFKDQYLKFADANGLLDNVFDLVLDGTAPSIQMQDFDYEAIYDSQNKPLKCVIRQRAKAHFNGDALNLSAEMHLYYTSQSVDIRLALHNPKAHVHDGGKWDLGNLHSCLIERAAINIKTPAVKRFELSLEQMPSTDASLTNAREIDNLQLVQHSSGGQHWDSPNHKTANNRVELLQQQPTLMIDGHSRETPLRPEPILHCYSNTRAFSVQAHHFWQMFPSSLVAASEHSASVCLSFTEANTINKDSNAKCTVTSIELQAGEKLSRKYSLYFSSSLKANRSSALSNVLFGAHINVASSLLEAVNTGVLSTSELAQCRLHKLIQEGLSAEDNFFAKREALDEYGWRNFGDIYADHEAANRQSSDIFVSHYNNQYDPLQGFLKQSLISTDDRWRELATDQFEHLVNIDIYHTELDKPEYNMGLFWHTDHYVPAETASHRTYSKHQQSDVYMDHAGGGGPGSHHCYSSGLALYYLLSGDERASSTVVNMAKWMRHIYEGDGTLLGLFLRIKNARHLRKPFSSAPLLGDGTGVVRNPFTDTYPMDRGTGNYVNVLLDAFEVTQDEEYLQAAEAVIVRTISNNDDIRERNFEDIENTWFYLVFLQSVAKYLLHSFHLSTSALTQRHFDNEQSTFNRIKAAFLHYSEYVLEHEGPYLENADKLEYPNDTWSAQDLRKVQVLVSAAIIYPSRSEVYLSKAKSLSAWIEERLINSDERHYTRVLVLIMQNYGALAHFDKARAQYQEHLKTQEQPKRPKAQGLVRHSRAKRAVSRASKLSRFWRFIRDYSITREKNNLLKRIPKLQKYLGAPSA